MFTAEQIDRLLNQGANVLSEDGEKIGSIGQVFVDNEGGQPSWVTVRTGLFGMSESFVPLEGARTEGNDIVVPYSKDQVKDAPRIDADRPLEPAEEDRLYQHYQLDTGRTYADATTDARDSGPGTERAGAPVATGDAAAPTAQRDTTAERAVAPAAGYDTTAPAEQRDTTTDRTQAPAAGYDTTAPAAQRDTTAGRSQAPAAGYDTTAPAGQRDTAPDRTAAPTVAASAAATPGYGTTAPAKQRGTEQRDTAQGDTAQGDAGAPAAPGRGRLRKYVTTEQVTKTVPVQREEVRLEREPITEENRDEASNRPDQGDERDVILHEERLIVTKETVPVERVHIGTETVTDEVTINEEVRKEHIDTEGPEKGRG